MAYNNEALAKVQGLKQLAQQLAADYATKKEVKTLSDQVEGLVTAGGEPNVITSVKNNGTALEITEKAVDIGPAIAAAVAAVDHLTKKKVASKAEIDPAAEGADKCIYLVPKVGSDEDDLYDEYMVLDGKVEHVGNTKIDLEGYVQKEAGKGLSRYTEKVKKALAGKQDVLTGQQGQVVGFDAKGKPVAQGTGSLVGPAGKNGVDGKDGVSMTHKWNGSTLTVTSASGTSSADLRGPAGAAGATGATGPAGKDGAAGAKGDPGLFYGTCDTAAGTAAKVVVCSGFTLKTGAVVAVKFTNANGAAAPTMNVNGSGAKAIYYADGKVGRSGIWGAGRVVVFVYDGTDWIMTAPSFAEGTGEASGAYAHAEGNGTASGTYSHAEGRGTAAAQCTHAEGLSTNASETNAHAEGYATTASGDSSHAEGRNTTANGQASHAEGTRTVAFGACSHAAGKGTYANIGQYVIGEYNTKFSESYNRFIVGKGTADTARANCFRVTDTGVYATGAHNTSGADYAELFEWADSNPEGEDRVGRFVTLEGEKLRLASPDDDFILGIVSGCPSVVGDVYDDQWQGMFLTDIFGRPLYEDKDFPAELGPDGEVILPAQTRRVQKVNPDYDNREKYIARTERPEWDAVGMLGKLVALDDGTCQPDGWCRVGPGGVATASGERTKYRVMARLDENHIRVLIL